MTDEGKLPDDINLGDAVQAPVALPRGEPVSAEQHRHLFDAFTRVTEDNDRLKDELSALKLKHDTETILSKLIIPYSCRAFVFMCIYCTAVFGLLILSLFSHPLPSPVLQTLVGSTAAAVIGLVGMVLTGIFVGARRKS